MRDESGLIGGLIVAVAILIILLLFAITVATTEHGNAEYNRGLCATKGASSVK